MDHVEIKEIVVHAKIGAKIGCCMREGIFIAAKNWQNVRLIHDNKQYFIRVNDLLATIQEEEA
jgi:hypothetical protein